MEGLQPRQVMTWVKRIYLFPLFKGLLGNCLSKGDLQLLSSKHPDVRQRDTGVKRKQEEGRPEAMEMGKAEER